VRKRRKREKIPRKDREVLLQFGGKMGGVPTSYSGSRAANFSSIGEIGDPARVDDVDPKDRNDALSN